MKISKSKSKSLFAMVLLVSMANAITLKDSIEKTINTNPGIIAEHKNQDAYKKYVDEEKGDYLPTIDFETYYETSHEYNNPDDASKNDASKNGWNAQLELEQILYDGGLTPSEIAEYQYKRDGNTFRSSLAIEDIIFETTSMYLNIVQYGELINLSTNMIKIHEKNLITALEKEDISGEKLETFQVSSKLHFTSERLYEQEDLSLESYNGFKKYAGMIPSQVCRPNIYENAIPSSLEETVKLAIRRNYSILEQIENIKVQREKLTQADAKFLPTLLFQLQAEWDDDLALAENGRQNEYRARLFMEWNLLEGGKHKAASQREKLFLQESKKVLDKVTDDIVSQVTNSYNSYNQRKKRVEMLKKYVQDNKNILDVYIEEFDAGTRTFIDILNAEAELYNSKTSLIGREFELYTSYYSLLSRLSMLSNTILSEKNHTCKNITYENLLDVQKKKENIEEQDADAELEGLFESDNETPKTENSIESVETKDNLISSSQNSNEDITEDANLKNDNSLISDNLQNLLDASPKSYTLNVTTETGLKEANYMLKKYAMEKDGYAFRFGQNFAKTKVLYGIYDTYKEAKEALNNLNENLLNKHFPYIDSVNKHQKLYNKYN